MDLETSTLTPLLKRLEVNDLVTRSRNPENERQVLIELTKQGRAIQRQAGCLSSALLAQSDMNSKKLASLNKAVRTLARSLSKNSGVD